MQLNLKELDFGTYMGIIDMIEFQINDELFNNLDVCIEFFETLEYFY